MKQDNYKADTPLFEQFEQREPVRAPSVHSDVLVPVYRALAYGLGTGVLVCLVALALSIEMDTKAWLLTFSIPMMVVLLVVLFTQFGWVSDTLWRIEEHTGKDLNGDGQLGQPPVFTSVNQYGKVTKHELTPEREKTRFIEFVHACYEGNTSVTTLARRGYSEGEIDRYRAILMRPDVAAARWKSDKSHQLGWVMTKPENYVIEVAERGLWRKQMLPKSSK